MGSLVSYRLDGSVATIAMDDGKVNAMSPAMIAELAKVDFVSAPGTSPPEVYRPGGPHALVETALQIVPPDLDRVEQHGFRIWNLGGNSPVSLRELIATVQRVTGRELPVKQVPAQPGDVERTYADLTRAGLELDFKPSTTLAEGVARQWQWTKANQSA